jgi:hypothetical protein
VNETRRKCLEIEIDCIANGRYFLTHEVTEFSFSGKIIDFFDFLK